MSVPASYAGGCCCGRIRYQVSAPPVTTFVCLCRQCQMSGGTEGAPVFVVPKTAVSITGAAKHREYVSERGTIMHAYFCGECGSRVYGLGEAFPDVVMFRAGCLDDPSWFRPQSYIFTADKQPWTVLPNDVPQFAKLPPGV